MNKQILAALVGAMACGAALAQTPAEGPWLVRARAVHIDARNFDSAGLGVTVNNKWIPEVDISYFFTPNVAAELILTIPQKHTVYLAGAPIGTIKHLPPTLTAQYHFTGLPGFKPYVGAGLNLTKFSSVTIPGLDISRTSTGLALQAGVDIPISKGMYLNLDVKKVYIKTDVKTAAGAAVTTLKVDPVLFGMGVGWRF